jgi:hypothetical protein
VHHEPCLRPQPLPVCRTCLLTQAAVVKRLGSTNGYRNATYGFYAMFDLGATRNLSQDYAVGADLYLGADDDFARFGVKARVRRWLGTKVAIDLAPGILLAASNSYGDHLNFPAFVGEVSVTYEGWLGVIGGVESLSWVFYPNVDCDCGPYRYTDTRWYLGGKLSGGPGLGLSIAGYLAVLVLQLASDYLAY